MKKIIKKSILFVGLTSLVVTPSFLQARGPCQGQQNMQKALQKISEAQSFLQKASKNKKGHRVKGLELIKKAKNEVIQGCIQGKGKGKGNRRRRK